MIPAGYQVSYSHLKGETFVLQSPDRGLNRERRVMLVPEGTEGWEFEADFDTTANPDGMGERVTSRAVLPAQDFTLGYRVTSAGQSLDWNDRDWRAAWVRDQSGDPGRLTVVQRDGGNYWTPVHLLSMSSLPHSLLGQRYFEGEAQVRSLAGCWFGPQRRYTGAVSVVPVGDFAPRVFLRWDGTSTSVTVPAARGAVSISLPALREDGLPTPWTRLIDLNYGMVGRLTVESSGAVDSAGWSALVGAVLSVTLTPHVASEWQLGQGLELLVTSRHMSPWR